MKNRWLLLSALFAVQVMAAESEWGWRKLSRSPQVWDPKVVASAPSETRRVRIVDFGQANCRWNNKVGYGYTTGSHKTDYKNLYVDTDGNPDTDDWVQTIPFSLTSPMSPKVPQWDTSWDSSTFYGGIGFIYAGRRDKHGLSEKYTNTAEGDEKMKPGSNWAVHAQKKVKGSPFRGYFSPIWCKKEFPHMGNLYPVSFDANSKIGLYTQRYWTGYEGVRFVLKDAGQLYISEVLSNNWRKGGGSGPWDLRIVSPLETRWAPWSMNEGDWDLKVSEDVSYEKRIFNDVEAIGFYIYKDRFDDVPVASKWECFEAYANVTHPKIPSETLDMRELNNGTYLATCETPYAVWKQIFRMSRSIGQFVFDEEPGMLYDRFGSMGSMRFGSETHTQAEPATDLTVRDILAWCNALSEYEGREFVYYTTPDFQPGTEFRYVIRGAWHKNKSVYEEKPIYVKWAADGFRLPTPSEWLAGREAKEPGWGAADSKGKTQSVGTKPANAKGLYDMQGNVWELLWTWGDKLPVATKAITVAGGDFNFPVDPLTVSASPYGDRPFTGSHNIGFRLLRREPGQSKPDTTFRAEKFSAPLWTINPETVTQTRAPETADIPLVEIPEGKLFDYDMTSFKMGAHEITHQQWKVVFDWAKANSYSFDGDGDLGSMDHRLYTVQEHGSDEPVTDISYFDMLAWCNALSEMQGLTPVFYADEARTKVYRNVYRYRQSQLLNRNYIEGHLPKNPEEISVDNWKTVPGRNVWVKWEADGYRLPSTYEWVYAYNAGATTTYPWGNNFNDVEKMGWVYRNAEGRIHPVGLKKPNAFGLYDMVGNVVELCVDSAGKGYGHVRGQTVNPLMKYNSYDYGSKTRATFRKAGMVHFKTVGFLTGKGDVNMPLFAGVVPGWYWADCGFRIVKRNAGDYVPEGIDLSRIPPPFLPVDLKRNAGEAPGLTGCDELQGKVYRGNLRRDGIFQTSGLPKPKGIKWSFKTGGKIHSSPVCVDGVVYVGSSDRSFYAIDAETGKEKWAFKTGTPVLSSAAVVGGMAFFTSGTQVYALDALTGKLKWKNQVGKRNAFGSPAVAYGVVFCPAGAGSDNPMQTSWGGWPLMGFDVQTGKVVWKQNEGRGPQGLSAPALSDGKLVWTHGYHACMMDIESGKHLWDGYRGPWVGAIVNPPVISGGFTFNTTIRGGDKHGNPLNGQLIVNDLETGKLYWAIHPYEETEEKKCVPPLDGKNHAIAVAPTVFGDLAYTADRVGDVHALNYKEKKREWKFQAEAGVNSTPSFADGILYFGCDDGAVYALNALTGKLRWKKMLGGGPIASSPWLADGVLYVGSDSGTLYAVH